MNNIQNNNDDLSSILKKDIKDNIKKINRKNLIEAMYLLAKYTKHNKTIKIKKGDKNEK